MDHLITCPLIWCLVKRKRLESKPKPATSLEARKLHPENQLETDRNTSDELFRKLYDYFNGSQAA